MEERIHQLVKPRMDCDYKHLAIISVVYNNKKLFLTQAAPLWMDCGSALGHLPLGSRLIAAFFWNIHGYDKGNWALGHVLRSKLFM